MGKGGIYRRYEDFSVGLRFECAGPRLLSSADVTAWISMTGDPTPRFADRSGRLHPVLALNIVQGQIADDIHGHATEELGVASLVVHRPLMLGAEIRTTARVIGMREDPSRETGVVWVRVAGRDDQGVAISYVHWFRARKKQRQSRPPQDSLPSLVDKVPMRELHTRTLAPLPARHDTNGRFLFNDYAPNETIFHLGGQHVAPGDIARFCRTFRVRVGRHHQRSHPDHSAPTGMVVGLAYALAHDGMENRVGLAAVNALRTPNLLREGDEVYAMSRIVDVEPLNETVGVVRNRLFLFRNLDPGIDPMSPPEVTDGKRYRDYIALDMDYAEIFPLEG